MTLFTDEEILPSDPTLCRIKALYLMIDECANKIYTFDEIIEKVRLEGFNNIPSKSSLSRLKNKYEWDKELSALTDMALTQTFNEQSSVVTNIMGMSEYLKKVESLNQKSTLMIEKWLEGLANKAVITEKEASVLAKIQEITGKTYDKILEKIAERENENYTKKNIIEQLKKSAINVRTI